jgi:hypothetical protein
VWELGLDFLKYNITIEKCTLEKVEKDFLTPFYSFTDEGVIEKALVSCINTMHVCIVICYAFRFFRHDASTSCSVIYPTAV